MPFRKVYEDFLFDVKIQECCNHVHLNQVKIAETSNNNQNLIKRQLGSSCEGLREVHSFSLHEMLARQSSLVLPNCTLSIELSFEDRFDRNGIRAHR